MAIPRSEFDFEIWSITTLRANSYFYHFSGWGNSTPIFPLWIFFLFFFFLFIIFSFPALPNNETPRWFFQGGKLPTHLLFSNDKLRGSMSVRLEAWRILIRLPVLYCSYHSSAKPFSWLCMEYNPCLLFFFFLQWIFFFFFLFLKHLLTSEMYNAVFMYCCNLEVSKAQFYSFI